MPHPSVAPRPYLSTARDIGLMDRDPGPVAPFRETKAAQKDAAMSASAAETAQLGAPKAIQLGADALAKAGRTGAAGILMLGGVAFTLYELTSIYEKAHAEGDELRRAIDKDALRLAALYTVQAALPKSYVDGKATLLSASKKGAREIVEHRMHGPDRASWKTFQASEEAKARRGVAYARAEKLDTSKKLAARLGSDPAVARALRGSEAFRHGVLSVVWQKEHAAGIAFARGKSVSSRSDLAALGSRTPGFAKVYERNPAFRLGVDDAVRAARSREGAAVVAKHHIDSFEKLDELFDRDAGFRKRFTSDRVFRDAVRRAIEKAAR